MAVCGPVARYHATTVTPKLKAMFAVDEATAEAIRRAHNEGGELADVVEFRRHFPLITDNAKAGQCVRIIAGWQPVPDRKSRVSGCPGGTSY